MTTEPQAIEVEVIEIDGIVPPAQFKNQEDTPQQTAWQDWQGRVRTLDRRWWPLWLLLGAVGIVLLLTVGLFLGIFFVGFSILRRIFLAIFR